MRIIIQRVTDAHVSINNEEVGRIGKGLVLLVGVHDSDTEETVDYMAKKVAHMRIFDDNDGKMNWALDKVSGDILSISQFTLYGRTKKGNRPSFVDAANPEHGDNMYQLLNKKLRDDYGLKVETGQFGADMQVSLTNDGPVTIILDSDE